jgi:hypothetical protein
MAKQLEAVCRVFVEDASVQARCDPPEHDLRSLRQSAQPVNLLRTTSLGAASGLLEPKPASVRHHLPPKS